MKVCLYSCLSYAAPKSYLFCAVLYCHLWPVWLYHILPHYLINGTIFGEKVIEHKMCALILPTSFVRNISYSKRDIIINVHRSSCRVPVILVRF
jgi:hypothetical protein